MNMFSNYEYLLDPNKSQDAIKLEDIDPRKAVEILLSMLRLRSAENKIALEKKNGIIKGPVHLSVGQEAIPVGISQHIEKRDYVFGAHRSHSHILALGSNIRKLFSEVLGKKVDYLEGWVGLCI